LNAPSIKRAVYREPQDIFQQKKSALNKIQQNVNNDTLQQEILKIDDKLFDKLNELNTDKDEIMDKKNKLDEKYEV
jgi:hypothetical protein